MHHDIIAIGASAGGVEVLRNLVGQLPAKLPASIFIAIHMSPAHKSPLPEILSARGPLPASHPLHEEAIERGHIYVAPPDNHLLLRQGSMQVVRGPKENGHRPAVDALFRSAAAAYGSRVIGVVLSGYQDCGTAGVMSIKSRGGLSVVQSPETALASEMPNSVIERSIVDYVVRPEELAALLERLVHTEASETHGPDPLTQQLEGVRPREAAELVCPLCSGAMTHVDANGFEHFRCHVGHAFSLQSLIHEQGEAMERALWAAARSLEESAALSHRVSSRESGDMKARFVEQALTYAGQAALIRKFLLYGPALDEAAVRRA